MRRAAGGQPVAVLQPWTRVQPKMRSQSRVTANKRRNSSTGRGQGTGWQQQVPGQLLQKYSGGDNAAHLSSGAQAGAASVRSENFDVGRAGLRIRKKKHGVS